MEFSVSVPGIEPGLEIEHPVRPRNFFAMKGLPPKARALARALQSWFPFESKPSGSLQRVLDDAFDRSYRSPLTEAVQGLLRVVLPLRKHG